LTIVRARSFCGPAYGVSCSFLIRENAEQAVIGVVGFDTVAARQQEAETTLASVYGLQIWRVCFSFAVSQLPSRETVGPACCFSNGGRLPRF
jgi:hypothetical protein